jgi:hypothetical protein
MKIGYAELLLAFAAVISFHDLKWGLSFAGLSLLVAFCRFAVEIQEKKEKKEEVENAARVLNEQAAELGSALSKLFVNIKSGFEEQDVDMDKKKYH